MKTYVISLKKSSIRRESMSNQLNKNNIDFEFLDATNKDDIDNMWIDENLNDYFKAEHQKFKHSFISKGALGCSDSHRRIWRKFIESNDEVAIILEDDCYFPPNSFNTIKKVSQDIENLEYDFINLYYTSLEYLNLNEKNSKKINNNFKIYDYPNQSTSSSLGYIITKNGAKKLLSSQDKKLTRMADAWDFDDINLKAGLIYPLCILTAGFPSTIVNQSWKISFKRIILNSLLFIPGVHNIIVPMLRKRISKVNIINGSKNEK